MIPIRDDIPTQSRPVITIGLIAVNTIVFVLGLARPDQGESITWKYGFLPAGLTHSADEIREALQNQSENERGQLVVDRFGRPFLIRQRPHDREATAVPAPVKLLTCMFLHGSWMHLIGNMLYLWIFGNNIEDRLGPVLYTIFYLGTGIIGTLAHTLIDPGGLMPLVGASGAISGVLGAYIMLFPHARVEALVPLGWYITTVMLPAWVFLGIYALLQLLYGLPALSQQTGGGVAYWAHIGGFLSGLAVIRFLPQRRHARPIQYAPVEDERDDGGFF